MRLCVQTVSTSVFRCAVLLVLVAVVGASACSRGSASNTPHVDHVTLPAHRTWRVVSVLSYEGLEGVALVRFYWPTRDNPSVAFTLTREGLQPGDPICLDHVQDINTYWAHPVPNGGCEALGRSSPASRQD